MSINNRLLRIIPGLAVIVVIITGSMLAAAPAFSADNDANSAVILMYHRFGDERYPATNIRMEQFRRHLSELAKVKYTVLPLEDIIAAQENGRPLPDRTIAITIDDGYKSIYDNAWPLLKNAGLPFTVFVSTDAIDEAHNDMMNWDQLREMAANGVTIAAHSGSHLHMPNATEARNTDEINRSSRRLREELGNLSSLFAYPYGETSTSVRRQVKDAGFKAAFGQHSGAFSAEDDRYYLPRFSMSERYGDMGRFKTAINALSLPVSEITPDNVYLATDNNTGNPPAIGFTLSRKIARINELSCFLSHEGKAKVELIGDIRFEIRVETPFPPGRTRLNCTLPGSGEHAGRWHWFGQMYYLEK